MISFEILFFSAMATGLVVPFCGANVLISSETKDKLYRMDLEIFKHVDRYFSVFRRAQVWEIFEEMDVKSEFNFFIEDDNVNEFKNYMKFISTNGDFYAGNSLTLSYSILYTKYTAVFYAINLLNIYKIKAKEFRSWDKDESIHKFLKNNKQRILNIYLKLSQYFAWYAYTGNDVLQKVEPYEKFATSFNNFLKKLDENIFEPIHNHILNKETFDSKKFWESVYRDSAEDIKIINQYFSTMLLGPPKNDETPENVAPENDDISNFVAAVQKETFIAKFVSNLSIMKGRDIEETYPNFDNKDKKEMYETSVVNVMTIIEDKEMESVAESFTELVEASKNQHYVVIQQSASKEVHTCLKFQLREHEEIL